MKAKNIFLVLSLVTIVVGSTSSSGSFESQRSLSRASSAPARLMKPPEIRICTIAGNRINGTGEDEGFVYHKGLSFTIPPEKLDEMRTEDKIRVNLGEITFDGSEELAALCFMLLTDVVRSGRDTHNWNPVFKNNQFRNADFLLYLLEHPNTMGDNGSIVSYRGNSGRLRAETFRYMLQYINWLNKNPDMIRYGGREGAMYLVLYAFLSKDLKHNPEYNPLRNAFREYFEGKALFYSCSLSLAFRMGKDLEMEYPHFDIEYLISRMQERDIDILRREGFDVVPHYITNESELQPA